MIDDSDKPFIERMDNRFAYAWDTLNAPTTGLSLPKNRNIDAKGS